MLLEPGRFPSILSIETQLLKYLQEIPSVKKDCYLSKAFNEELTNKESGWVTKVRHLLDSYAMSDFILKILKVLKDEIDKKEYKTSISFPKKEPKTSHLKTLGTQMGYPISVPNWSLQKSKSIKIIGSVVKAINN